MEGLTLCPAAAGDAEEIFALAWAHVERWEDFSLLDRGAVERWMRRKTELRIGEYRWVLFRGERAGVFRTNTEEGRLELDDLYLLPPFRGRGIGPALILDACRCAGLPAFLYVFRANTRARMLYERLGFRRAADAGATRIIMERPAERSGGVRSALEEGKACCV